MQPKRLSSDLRGRMKRYDSYDAARSPNRRVSIPANRAFTREKPISKTQVKKPVTLPKPKPSQQTFSRPQKLTLIAVGSTQFSPSESFDSMFVPVRKSISWIQKSIYGLGVIVFVLAAAITVQSFLTNQQAQDQIATLGVNTTQDSQGVLEGTGNEPSESPVSNDALYSYQVRNPEDPRYLRIPAIDVEARIKNLGVTDQGAVDAPWNIHDAGWFNGSARPGSSRDASLLLGHVSGWTGPGVFKEVDRLEAGMLFEVEKGSGEVVQYEVVRSERIPLEQVDMGQILSVEDDLDHDLKLMTCAGAYNSETETFEDRFVVYAKRV